MAATTTKRRKRSSDPPTIKAKLTGLVLLVLSVAYMYFLWRVQGFLDVLEGGRFRIPTMLAKQAFSSVQTEIEGLSVSQHQEEPETGIVTHEQALQEFRKPTPTNTISASTATGLPPPAGRFLIFVPIGSGQGTGNIVAGLLAAHLLALEFGRIVCVSPLYDSFLAAFEPVHPDAVQKCPQLLLQGNLPTQTQANTLRVINFERVPDECALQAALASDTAVLYMISNTYPRWPAIPNNFFFTYYKAKPELLQLLPYQQTPAMVVHLRQPDGKSDSRQGLDEDSLQALGKTLPKETYLVTNRVDWYDKFEGEYGWGHPSWNEVVHSAFQKSWGVRGALNQNTHMVTHVDRLTQNLQMWCDWYTILCATKVHHTHSDFSISAIHWQNLESRTIIGWNATTVQLELEEESWRQTGETERLVDRTVHGPGTSELRECNKEFLAHDFPDAATQLLRKNALQ